MKKRSLDGRYILVDKAYIRQQAAEAVRTFVAPLSGVYEAAAGKKPAAPSADRLKKSGAA